MIFCFWTCWNVKISYKFRHFLRFEHQKLEQNDLNMLLNTSYYIDIWYSYISGKFHWLILYILLVMNDFVFLNLLKYQNFVQISAFFVLWTSKIRTKWFVHALKYFLLYRYMAFLYIWKVSMVNSLVFTSYEWVSVFDPPWNVNFA